MAQRVFKPQLFLYFGLTDLDFGAYGPGGVKITHKLERVDATHWIMN